MLDSLETELNEQLEKSDENPKLFKYLHKVLRDKARLYFLCKDRRAEKKMEEDSQFMYSHYLEARGVKSHEGMWCFPIVNIKIIKIMFNRAYRMSHSQPEKAI